eukprot:jgi/Tetstr1/446437/TSEL_033979.t1
MSALGSSVDDEASFAEMVSSKEGSPGEPSQGSGVSPREEVCAGPGSVRTIVVAGTSVGVGKTTIALGLMACLRDAGYSVAAFKIGPDFLDPTLHEAVTGRKSGNLDGWMMSREQNLACFHRHVHGADIAVVEGVVGLFDGRDGASEDGSTAQMAKWLGAPVVLVLDCEGMGRSAAAVMRGYEVFDPDLRIAGVILNRVGGVSQLEWLKSAFAAANVKATVLAGLPKEESLVMLSATQMRALPGYLERVCHMVAKRVHVPTLVALAAEARCPPALPPPAEPPATAQPGPGGVKIGVAQDDAFCFYYKENLAQLEAAGAELVPFSPISQPLPLGLSAIYLGGGFPENYASQLSANLPCLLAIRAFAAAGGVIYAECGGLMYLTQSIEPLDGSQQPAVGLLPFRCQMSRNRMKMGYVEVEAQEGCELLPAGLTLRGHFLHFNELVYSCQVSSPGGRVEAGAAGLLSQGWRAGFSAREGAEDAPLLAGGFTKGRVLASPYHLHWGSQPGMARALVAAASQVDVHAINEAVEDSVLEGLALLPAGHPTASAFPDRASAEAGQSAAVKQLMPPPGKPTRDAMDPGRAKAAAASHARPHSVEDPGRSSGSVKRNLHESLSATDMAGNLAASRHHRHSASMPGQPLGTEWRLPAQMESYKAALAEMSKRLRDIPRRLSGNLANQAMEGSHGQLGYNRMVRHQPGGASSSWQSLTGSPEYGSRGMWASSKSSGQQVPMWFHTVSPHMPRRPSQQELILDDGTRVVPTPGHLVSPQEVAASSIVSFLPSATEIIFALHLESRLIGVSDLCDYPPQVANYPVVVRSKVDAARMSSEEVTRKMAQLRASGESPFAIDEDFLRREGPGLVLTQDTCSICSADSSAALVALRNVSAEGGAPTTTLVLGPRTVAQMLTCILQIGVIAGVPDIAIRTVDRLQERLRGVVAKVAASPRPRPRVVSLEGLSPLVLGGHWLPDVKRLAGGLDTLQEPGDRAEKISWDTLRSHAPEVLILSPCSSDLQRSLSEVSKLADLPGWWSLPAVRNGQVYICQHYYFSRPGPRLVDGIEILARILHPEAMPARVPEGAVLKLTLSGGRRCRHRLLPNYFEPFL